MAAGQSGKRDKSNNKRRSDPLQQIVIDNPRFTKMGSGAGRFCWNMTAFCQNTQRKVDHLMFSETGVALKVDPTIKVTYAELFSQN
jgi:hypothetical protein